VCFKSFKSIDEVKCPIICISVGICRTGLTSNGRNERKYVELAVAYFNHSGMCTEGLRMTTKPQPRIAVLLVDIQTQNLLNTKQ
jgi:hypothetical protein